MVEAIVSWFWMAAALYAAAGIAFSLPFLIFWSRKMDPLAKGGTWGFRLAIFPATVALWPLLALKACRGEGPPNVERPLRPAAQRNLHGLAFVAIAVAMPLICGAALRLRTLPVHSQVRLEVPSVPGMASVVQVDAKKLPIRAEVITGASRDLRLDVTTALADPVVAAYWSPAAAVEGIGPDAVFLGSVWGPGRMVFPLPASATPGVITFIALAGDQHVLETIVLK